MAALQGKDVTGVIVGTLRNQYDHYTGIYALGMDATDIAGLHNRVTTTAKILNVSLGAL